MTTKHERNAAKAKARSKRNTQRHENAQDRRRARRQARREDVVPAASYDDLSVRELKALCKKRSIPYTSRTRKPVLVKALELKDQQR